MAGAIAISTIPDGCTDSATSLTVRTGEGAQFAFETGDTYRFAQLVDADALVDDEWVVITDVTGDVLTVSRGQRGSTAAAFGEDSQILSGLSAPEYDEFVVVVDSMHLAPAAEGVTNGNSHDHAGGDGAAIPLAGMANIAPDTILGSIITPATAPQALTAPEVRLLLGLSTANDVVFANVVATNLLSFAGTALIDALQGLTTTPANVKGLWLFNPVTGVAVSDRSGLAHTVDLSADAATLSPGIGGLARNLTFSASAWWDTVDHDDFSITGPAAFTIIRLVKPVDVTGCTLAGKYSNVTAAVNVEYLWAFDDADKMRLRIYNNNSSSAYIGRSYNTALTGDQAAWHVYAATYSNGTTSAAIKLYRDGVKIDDTDSAAGSYTGPANSTAKLGSYAITTDGSKIWPLKAADGAFLFVKEEWSALQIERASRLLLGYAGTLA